ncbi:MULTISPECIES: hypothetical protein [Legionella]|uniref:Uncharacterized protein n=1 Tax=Legionella septentrionalis TaxID=2498109 RepID=A0A433JM13_9GAMM|nr:MULTISPECIES: hypothetical protein [Legionella]MCP0914829.1 hypothetical protein [Legionella sp. 27cVA30]RUQ91036.1 hypothetical protein EKM59_00715 [Legionella septentrionalis]RUR02894.1 hypothetical protein ELY11_00630 [Legionella septentrionalis]RUR11493.1 hypothetical protein ELY14_01740 [Legionella septentrionalis]RUR16758.1 hypothetical protein ELY10_02455 [Legionella septentrionalis]
MQQQRHEANKHKAGAIYWFKSNRALFLALLIPAFFVGWSTAKKISVLKLFKQFGSLVFLSTIATLKVKVQKSVVKSLSRLGV